jgi:hypothetical protein
MIVTAFSGLKYRQLTQFTSGWATCQSVAISGFDANWECYPSFQCILDNGLKRRFELLRLRDGYFKTEILFQRFFQRSDMLPRGNPNMMTIAIHAHMH